MFTISGNYIPNKSNKIIEQLDKSITYYSDADDTVPPDMDSSIKLNCEDLNTLSSNCDWRLSANEQLQISAFNLQIDRLESVIVSKNNTIANLEKQLIDNSIVPVTENINNVNFGLEYTIFEYNEEFPVRYGISLSGFFSTPDEELTDSGRRPMLLVKYFDENRNEVVLGKVELRRNIKFSQQNIPSMEEDEFGILTYTPDQKLKMPTDMEQLSTVTLQIEFTNHQQTLEASSEDMNLSLVS